MAYGETFEGTGEELAKMFAAMGQRKLRVTVRDEAKTAYDPKIWERNDEILRRIMKGAPLLPERSFTAEDFYSDED